ncbi:MAG: ribose-5-phosphate isomerase RpiA [Ignavibacteriales bacterium]|nr:ribose-5-phosphate isomerase RpiA [Ignavibacteriales bacterium]MCB9209280.1 ribose-5-phosphate isomerase RpiA [Ignavibacteriales bacterium]
MNEEFKKLAAEKAVEEIETGMVVGLGSGSTVYYAIQKLAQEIRTGNLLNIVAIASSIQTEKLANKLDIPLITFHDKQKIDVTIDGADEVDKYLNLIKGGGAAHLREKILVQASDKFIVVVDDSKLSNKLGEKWAVPVEVIKFAYPVIASFIESINGEPNLRTYESGIPVLTDEGNYIIDANFGVIQNPFELAEKLENRAGIVEHGLFLRLSSKVIVAGQDGIKILEK